MTCWSTTVGADAADDGAKTSRPGHLIETAGIDQARHNKTACLRQHGRNAAGGAADCSGARVVGDDGEGEISRAGCILGDKLFDVRGGEA